MKSSISLAALALAGSVVADDVLFSKRLSKRAIDDNGNYNMSFFHINDVHAHLDEFKKSGTDCTDPKAGCFGGYARIKTKVDELRKAHPDNLWLNAGDEFQGTLFYSFYGPEKIAVTLNELKFDAMTLGNHEWDGGDEELGAFLANITFPVVSCNVKSEYKPLKDKIKNYQIFKEHDLAVIGVTTDTTPGIANVGKQTKFLDPIEEVQKSIWEIRNKTDIRRIVALTHVGYDVDKELAARTEGLSLIMGGHSHTLLGDMENALGKYPTIVENAKGDEVFIVTAYRWGEYLGQIDLTFDKDGKALAYHGAPIHMDNKTALDPALNKTIKAWRGPFEKFAAEQVGTSDEVLDQEKCRGGDCLLGQVMSDAMLEYRVNATKGTKDPAADFAIVNSGGVRATINKGKITRGDVLNSFPFGNAIVELEMTGSKARGIIEDAVSRFNQKTKKPVTSWFQVSKGVKIAYNPNNNNGSKLISFTIDGKEVEGDRKYRVVTLDFIAGGGDNIMEKTTDLATLDTQDEVLIGYLKAHNPVTAKLEERVVTTDEKSPKAGGEKSSGDGKGAEGDKAKGDKEGAAATVGASIAALAMGMVVAVALM